MLGMHRLHPAGSHLGRAAWSQLASGRRRYRLPTVAMAKVWRPDMNDVDRLSRGDGAKKRGTGNFNIPHRLNSDERPVYEAAKKKGYLQVRGTGYRKGRKGNPLPNVYRQWCDAKAQPCIVIEQDMTGSSTDCVVVDLAPLRVTKLQPAMQACHELAAAAGARHVPPAERPLEAVPFNVIPVDFPQAVHQMLYPDEPKPSAERAAVTPEQISATEQTVLQQADLVRQLKAACQGNSDPEVQRQVQALLQLKAELQRLLEAAAEVEDLTADTNAHSPVQCPRIVKGSMEISNKSSPSEEAILADVASSSSSSRKQEVFDEDHPFVNVAIWQLPVMPLFFEADRAAAKTLAKNMSASFAAAVRR